MRRNWLTVFNVLAVAAAAVVLVAVAGKISVWSLCYGGHCAAAFPGSFRSRMAVTLAQFSEHRCGYVCTYISIRNRLIDSLALSSYDPFSFLPMYDPISLVKGEGVKFVLCFIVIHECDFLGWMG